MIINPEISLVVRGEDDNVIVYNIPVKSNTPALLFTFNSVSFKGYDIDKENGIREYILPISDIIMIK